jgi:hypothetical protein
MDENNFIEPLTETETEDDVSNAEMPVGAREITSDYDPSDTDTRFGSLTSSVNDHVWEYGRLVWFGKESLLLHKSIAN